MDLFQAMFLGLMQGIVEWLPISSEGQLMAFSLAFLKLNAMEALRWAVFLHFGTVAAAAFYFRKEIREMLLLKKKNLSRFILIALFSTPITAIPTYLLLKAFITSSGIGFVLAGIGLLLIAMGIVQHKKKLVKKTTLSAKNAFFVGLGQGFSVLPGISRSGTTTSILLFEGFEPERAFYLSFLLSVPSVLLASIGFGFLDGFVIDSFSIIGVLVSALAGFASISLLLRVAKRIRFSMFCIGFGLFYGLLGVLYFI